MSANASSLKVTVNRAACCGYGLCAEICPQIFKLDPNGIVFVESDRVPEGLETQAREAVEACPQSALGIGPANS